ncbi:MAG TPA: hypothetical protein VHG89_10555 [Verrucomicrobiae bacterium]|nr:hypothetical protein [Verrucomicrobiae bacterium]
MRKNVCESCDVFTGTRYDPRACRGIWKKCCPAFEVLDLWCPWGNSVAVGEMFWGKQEFAVLLEIQWWMPCYSWPKASLNYAANAMGYNPTTAEGRLKSRLSEQREADAKFIRFFIVAQQTFAGTGEVLHVQIQAEAAEKSHRRFHTPWAFPPD